VLVGVTGGIAAYKAAHLVRLFVKNGDAVRVVMTEAACRFIPPLTMEALCGNPVCVDMFRERRDDPSHVELAKWADVFVVAPATANTIAKMAAGIADNLLTATLLAFPRGKKIFIAPAMHPEMWSNPVTQRNLQLISTFVIIVGPETGILASGEEGKGVMSAPEEIFSRVTGEGG